MLGAIASHYTVAAGYDAEVAADSPLGHWTQGDTSGTTMTDVITGRNGTYPGSGVTLNQASLLTSDASKSVDYSGGTSSVADAAWMDVTTMTIEAVIRPDTVNSGSYNFIASRDSAAFGPWWFVTQNAKLQLGVWVNGGGSPTQVSSVTSIAANVTKHVAATFDGSNVRLYISGVLDKTQAVSGTLNSGDQPIRIGNWISSSLPFDGRLQKIAFYGTALSGARLAAHVAAM